MAQQRKPRTPPARVPEPDENFNEPEPDVRAALDLAQEIQDMIDDAPDEVAIKACDFFESVGTGAKDMAETIERMQRVSPKQLSALENWKRGVERWINRD